MELTERFMRITEHLLFVALMLPTFVLLAALAVSLTGPDAPAATPLPVQSAQACECPAPERLEIP
jgi:hypothetical protein